MDKTDILKGTGTALVTPFTEDPKIDYNGLLKLLDYNADNGIDYLVVNGTTGESATTSKTEKREILQFVLDHNARGLHIVYGTGGYDTMDIVEHVSEMDWAGVTALLSVSPYYNRPSQQGIVAHYEAVADACPVPVILYNVPKRTGANMTAETTLTLSQHPNIVGIKEASGDFGQIVAIATQKKEDFLLISGDDMCAIPMISLGAVGVISVMANAFPQEMSSMVRAALASDHPTVMKHMRYLNKINPLMYVESSPVGVKEALRLKGICSNVVRLPLVPSSKALSESIQKAM
jgi:4-hydroxy-tetrahydrodipicolinate synthase